MVVIIAGPNGAGKTAFAMEYLPDEAACPNFVNTDSIAAGSNPFRPEIAAVRAGRIALREIDARARTGASFAFKTTPNGRSHTRRIREWRLRGYRARPVFLRLPTPEMAVARSRDGLHWAATTRRRKRFAGDFPGLAQFRGSVPRSGR